MKKSLLMLPALMMCAQANSQQLAFPGAEGFGAYATGGRGGTVVHVTNLNASGPGSLADAVSQPNRTVVFDVGGVIDITGQNLTIASNLTIAGQTAPGEGITIYGGRVIMSNSSNVIMRYIRMRGSISMPEDKCTLTMDYCDNVILDHCSISWGRWDNVHIKDANNMGAAMAPAAADTLKRHLFDTGRTVEDYDLIITGDLGSFGSELFLMLLNDAGIDAGTRHLDCGNIIFSAEQNAVCGGSGCGSRSLCAGLQELIRVAGVADCADVGKARNLVAVFIEFLKQGAGGGGFAFELRLVRLIGEEDIADVYMVADILLPLANDARFDCNAFLGHQYAFCHKCFTPILISIICLQADIFQLLRSAGRCGAW